MAVGVDRSRAASESIAPGHPVPAPARHAISRTLVLWLAAVGLMLTVWMVWTIVSWVGAGNIHQITRYRNHSQASWVASIIYESVFGGLAVGLALYVAGHAWRRRRVTFDAVLLLGLFTSAWLDPAFNFYRQIFLYSSQFVNVNAWCGQMPGIRNGECGRMPEPLVIPPLYMMVLLAAMIAGKLIGRARARTERSGRSWTLGRTLLLAGAVGVVFDFMMEMPALALHLWSYSSNVSSLAPPGLRGADRYTLTTAFTFGFICASITALRVHRDDRGRTLLEAGASTLRAGWRRAVVVLAVIAWAQLTVIVSFVPAMVSAPYAGAWPSGLPGPLRNGLCDNNASPRTPYPCPRSTD